MVGLGPLDLDRALLEEADGAADVAAVGQRAAGDDAAFGHELTGGVGGAQLVPELVCLGVPPEGPVGVGQHGVLVDRTGEMAEVLELDRRRLPAAEAVEGDAVELADSRDARGLVDERLEEPLGFLVALTFEGLGRLHQTLLYFGGLAAGDGGADVGRDVGRGCAPWAIVLRRLAAPGHRFGGRRAEGANVGVGLLDPLLGLPRRGRAQLFGFPALLRRWLLPTPAARRRLVRIDLAGSPPSHSSPFATRHAEDCTHVTRRGPRRGPFSRIIRRRPTLPGGLPPSTLGA